MFLMEAIEDPWRNLAGAIVCACFGAVFLILFIIAVVCTIKGFKSDNVCDRWDAEDNLITSIALFIILVADIVGIIICSVGYSTGSVEYKEWYDNPHQEIVYNNIYSLTRENETSGHFVLGCGNVNTDTYYYFYVKKNTDIYQLTKLKVDNNVYIKEVDYNYSIVAYNDANSDTIYYHVNVPKGTIIQSYNI